MKINATKFYISMFIIVLFLQLYLNSFKLNVFFQVLVLIIFFTLEKPIISKKFLKTILPLILIFFIGFLGILANNYKLFNVIKDIFHFLKPLTGLAIGYLLFMKINDFKLFAKTIVISGFISAFFHFFIILFVNHSQNSVAGLREFSKDNFLELVAFFFLVFYKKFQKESLFQSKTKYYVFYVVLFLSIVLYLSRTMFVSGLIIVLSVYGFTIITSKTIKILVFGLLAILVFYAYLFSIKLDRDSFFYKIKNAPLELFKVKIDRENHADLWDHWRGYEAQRTFALMKSNPSSFLIGCGFGSLVNLKFFAPLSENPNDKGMKYISELHNGYAYILYKTGIIGFVLYFLVLINLYRKIFLNRTLVTVFISGLGLIFVFTTLTITGFYNGRDVFVLILGALMFFEKPQTSSKVC